MILRHLLYVLRHIIVLFFMIAIFKTVTDIYIIHYCNMSEATRPFVVNKCMYVCMTTPKSRMTTHSIRMMTTPVTTPVRQRPYQLTQLLTSARCVSWHGVTVIHASRWCRAVINAYVSRVPTKCTRTRLSSLPHAYQRVAASVLT